MIQTDVIKHTFKQEYPEYFPKGCPPTDASTESKVLFRFCEGESPSENDFTSYYLRNPKKYANNILAYGLSVLPSADECRNAYRKYPYLRKYHSIAVGETGSDRGAWKVTPGNISPEHITWWVCKDVKPYEFFVFDSKVGEDDE